MKKNPSNHEDSHLSAVLKEWSDPPSLPPRFQEQVWRRIDRSEKRGGFLSSLAAVSSGWLAAVLPKPALATAYVILLLLAGAGMGWSQARSQSEQIVSELGTRYAQSVDPYLAVSQP